jgi:hypothetical protein
MKSKKKMRKSVRYSVATDNEDTSLNGGDELTTPTRAYTQLDGKQLEKENIASEHNEM